MTLNRRSTFHRKKCKSRLNFVQLSQTSARHSKTTSENQEIVWFNDNLSFDSGCYWRQKKTVGDAKAKKSKEEDQIVVEASKARLFERFGFSPQNPNGRRKN